MSTIHVLNGPNLNLLGQREPEIYGSTGLSEIEQMIREKFSETSWELSFFQSNAEHELVEYIQKQLGKKGQYFIINPGAFTHTSVAIRDALLAIKAEFIEVHLSNIHNREEFRQKSWFSDIAMGTISGLGIDSYLLAAEHLINNK